MVFEASGIDETTNGVSGQVAESQGDASEVLEASVYSFGGAVGGTGMVSK